MAVRWIIGCAGRGIVAVGLLVLAAPAPVQAQVGLASGAARITLVARVSPKASLGHVSPARETDRRGTVRDETVTVRLSANTGYRLVVVGTAPASSPSLWVRVESGRFEEVRSGAAVTVIRGRHAVVEWEPELTFRSERSESAGPHVIPVRYEVRIDPAI